MTKFAQSLRIGGASGFWGDADMATAQLLQAKNLDFIVYDYLAEITMAILARARAQDPDKGYVADFITAAMAPNLPEIAAQGVRIISNAGAMNPLACAAALRDEIARQGLDLSVACVTGDDLMPQLGTITAQNPRDMFSDAPFPNPDKIASINAYLGAFPIAAALKTGADIVITGRCVDSAVTLAACIHAFGWQADNLDLLAAGSLAGHILECGPQATGGNFTDWQLVADTLTNIGYPIAHIHPNGSFDVTKPSGTGGLVSRATVGEQMLYEIGDPQAYVLPDVICDFSAVTLTDIGPDLVRVTGARGRGVPDTFKTCTTWHDGYRGGHLFGYYGLDAEAKATLFSQTALTRARTALAAQNMPDFTQTSVEILGAEAQFGAQRQSAPSREVAAKIAVRHPQAAGISVFIQQATGLGLAAPPGLSGFAGARPKPSPVLALFSCLTPKAQITILLHDACGATPFSASENAPVAPAVLRPSPPAFPQGATVLQPLVNLSWARSGDKGDSANIGLIARHPAYLPALWHGITDDLLHDVFGHFHPTRINRYLLPGTHALNIVLHNVLGGGGTSSLRNDPQAKGYAQLLLAASIAINPDLIEETK